MYFRYGTRQTPEEYKAKASARYRKHRAAHLVRVRARNRDWARQHPEVQKQYRASHKDHLAAAQLLRKLKRLGIDPATLTPRPDRCEICGRVGLVVMDHDHKTGKFRGWPCHGCNVILGHACDDPETLRLLALYLEKHSGRYDSKN
jgi:hypothetical protein